MTGSWNWSLQEYYGVGLNLNEMKPKSVVTTSFQSMNIISNVLSTSMICKRSTKNES